MTDDNDLVNKAFEPLVSAALGNPRALLMLADKAFVRADLARGVELVDAAIALDPGDIEIAAIGADLIARSVPNWHVRMVKDAPRNTAFQNAIERAVSPEKRVLDIGAGSGLLAMMAARAGATIVHSCEMNPSVATVAQKIVAANGFAEQITVHSKKSTQLDAVKDLDGKADIIVAEIVGNDLVCENVLPTMRDAARRLAAPDAQYIPRSGDIRVALAWFANRDARRLDDVCGFDLSAFNALLPVRSNANVGDPSLAIRGEAASLYSFDFASCDIAADQTQMELVATGGKINGVAQWFRLQLDEHEMLENMPGTGAQSSWACEFYAFDDEIDTTPGDQIKVGATIFGNRLRLWRA